MTHDRSDTARLLPPVSRARTVVFASLFGEYLGINDALGSLWFWFDHQGSEPYAS